MLKSTKPYALITGASSGIGEATSRVLAQNGYSLILVARRKNRLEVLAKDIQKRSKVDIKLFPIDVSSYPQVDNFAQKNPNLLKKVSLLVNNAGLAKGLDPIQSAKINDWDQMIDTNIKGLLYFTRIIVPHMIKNKCGHIVMLGSVAGYWTYPKGSVYCATKAAVKTITEALRMDLIGTGVRVTSISPGMVETEFSNVRVGDPKKAKAVYEAMTPLNANDIAEAIVWSVKRPAHVNIQEMIIYPTDQASPTIVHRADSGN